MPRTCHACAHPKRTAIDESLIAGANVRALSALYRVSEHALGRHKRDHLPAALVKAQDAAEIAHADRLLAEANRLYQAAIDILDEARADNPDLALKAISTAGRMLALLGEVMGHVNRAPTINLWVSAEWITVRTTLLEALAPYPEARVAVADQLIKLEGG